MPFGTASAIATQVMLQDLSVLEQRIVCDPSVLHEYGTATTTGRTHTTAQPLTAEFIQAQIQRMHELMEARGMQVAVDPVLAEPERHIPFLYLLEPSLAQQIRNDDLRRLAASAGISWERDPYRAEFGVIDSGFTFVSSPIAIADQANSFNPADYERQAIWTTHIKPDTVMHNFNLRRCRRVKLSQAYAYSAARVPFNCNDTLFGLNLKDHGAPEADVFVVFSYGSHWPLLIDMGDVLFVNDQRSSATTNRHLTLLKPYLRPEHKETIDAETAVKMVNNFLTLAKAEPEPEPPPAWMFEDTTTAAPYHIR